MIASREPSLVQTKAPVVSIVVPVFNRPERIPHVVRNVRAQSVQDWELIIVDDASTTDLTATVEPFLKDPRIRYLRLQVNGGPGSARNRGIEHAEGQYIAFLDSDDSWLPEKLERQLAAMAEHLANRAFCITLTTINMEGGWSRIRPNFDPRPDQSFAEYLYCDGGFFQASSLLLPRELALTVKFAEGLRQYEDHLYFIELQASGAIYLVVRLPLTIWNNDTREDRLSSVEDIDGCETFLRQAASFLSPSVETAFRMRVMGSILFRRQPLELVKLLIKTCLQRAIAPKQLAIIVARISLPSSFWAFLRRRLS